jgi:transcriptional regulator GlxA family with amidase domain
MRIGIVLFEGVEELDAVGPWEVLAAWADRWPEDGVEVLTLAPAPGPVRCAKGLVLVADTTWDAAPALDVVVFPGGSGTRAQLGDERVRAWVRGRHEAGALMTSVCTGALVFADAGLLAGRPATTHWSAFAELAAVDGTVEPRPDDRFVDTGDVITAAGVSAGIDVALHLVARLHSTERAREVRRYIQYDPAPPV